MLEPETDAFKLAEAKPANVWLGAPTWATRAQAALHAAVRVLPPAGQRLPAPRGRPSVERRDPAHGRYGSRLSTEDQRAADELLSAGWRRLREHLELLATPAPWDPTLAATTAITEWPIGDAMSQTHDQLLAQDGTVYVADNIQDRIYRIDPRTNEVTVFKIPHRDGDAPGGLLAARLKDFPRHDSTSNAHRWRSRRRTATSSSPRRRSSGWSSSTRRRAPSRCTTSAAASARTPSASTRRTGSGSRSPSRTRSRCSTARRSASRCTTCRRGAGGWLTVTLIRPLFTLMSWGRAARELAAGGPARDRHAAALRHRHHARRHRLVRAAAHRRDRQAGPGHRHDPDGRDAVAGPRRLRSDAEGNCGSAPS